MHNHTMDNGGPCDEYTCYIFDSDVLAGVDTCHILYTQSNRQPEN